MKYRKKPVVIEARQMPEGSFGAIEVYQWIEENTLGSFEPMSRITGEEPWPESGVTIDPRDGRMVIATLEGGHWVDTGDYVIRGVAGEFYPCKPDIFEATYELVEDSRWFAANARIGWLIERVEDGKRFRIAGLHDGDVLTLTTTDPQEPGPTFKTSDWPFTIFKVEET